MIFVPVCQYILYMVCTRILRCIELTNYCMYTRERKTIQPIKRGKLYTPYSTTPLNLCSIVLVFKNIKWIQKCIYNKYFAWSKQFRLRLLFRNENILIYFKQNLRYFTLSQKHKRLNSLESKYRIRIRIHFNFKLGLDPYKMTRI